MTSLILAPGVLLADLLFLLWSEVVLDVECTADLFWRLSLDHVGNSLAGDIEKSLDVQIVGSQDKLEESSLVDLKELDIPAGDVVSSLLAIVLIIAWSSVVVVVLAPANDLSQDRSSHILDWDWLLGGISLFVVESEILEKCVDSSRETDDVAWNLKIDIIQLTRRTRMDNMY